MNRDRGVPAGLGGGPPGGNADPRLARAGADATGLGAIANSPQIQRLREVGESAERYCRRLTGL